MKRITILFIAILPILGCGSFTTHCRMPMSCRVGDPRYEAPTPIYGGVASDCLAIGEYFAVPIPGVNKKEYLEWWIILLLPLPIIDVPFSFILDTIYLPGDISFWESWSAVKKRAANRSVPFGSY